MIQPHVRRPPLRRAVVVAVVAVVAIGAGLAAHAWAGRAPFSPGAVSVDLKAQVIDSSSANARDVRDDLDVMSGRPGAVMPWITPSGRYVIGQITIHAPKVPTGAHWALVAVDKGSGQGMHAWGSDSPMGGASWQGSWGHQLGDRYSWLSELRDVQGSSGVSNAAMALDIPGGTTRAITFSITSLPFSIDDTGLIPGSGGTREAGVGPSTPLSMAYVTMALVLVKPSGDVWWAERLIAHD
jgi:hypothetical protein